ncbi:hypothetical protein [Nonomuraea lactucae]|uniref:hypothetical protein n=1 Tax=Nonomuraea lactucae TaxID=2249762 RepID=UPI000DE234A9|nr:hypothetical protein [Nonomuraea lactucae]
MFDFINSITGRLVELATPTNIGLAATGALNVLLMVVCIRMVKARRRSREADTDPLSGDPQKPVPWANRLTYLSAFLASAIAAQGMFMWLKDVLGFHPIAAFLACAFVELAMLVSALRARDSLKEPPYTTGPDGKAVWMFAALSGVLSASHAASISEAFGRLAVTMVAGWLWERSLQVERKALTGRTSSLQWAISPTRVLIWLGLADPTTRDTNDIARERRLDLYVRAIYNLHVAQAGGNDKAIRRAHRAWERAYRRAVEYARVDVNPEAAAIVAAKVDAIRERATLVERIESAPSAPARAELPPAPPRTPPATSSAKGKRPRPAKRSAPPADVDDLMPLGWQIATAHEAQGLTLTRDRLLAAVRATGQSLSSERASALLARLKSEAPANLIPAQRQPDGESA